MKKLALFVTAVLGTLLISACIKVENRINADGSGTWEFGMLVSEAALRSSNEDSSSVGAEIILSLLDGESVTDEESGIVFTAEERLQNGAYWTYVIANVPDIDRWSRVPEAFQRSVMVEEDDLNELSAFYLAPNVSLNREMGIIRAEINAAPPTELGGEEFTSDSSTLLIQFSYEIIMPGEITDHNGTIDPLTGNPIWILDFTSSEPIEFYAEAQLEE